VLHLSHEDFKINLKGVKICEWKKVDWVFQELLTSTLSYALAFPKQVRDKAEVLSGETTTSVSW